MKARTKLRPDPWSDERFRSLYQAYLDADGIGFDASNDLLWMFHVGPRMQAFINIKDHDAAQKAADYAHDRINRLCALMARWER